MSLKLKEKEQQLKKETNEINCKIVENEVVNNTNSQLIQLRKTKLVRRTRNFTKSDKFQKVSI